MRSDTIYIGPGVDHNGEQCTCAFVPRHVAPLFSSRQGDRKLVTSTHLCFTFFAYANDIVARHFKDPVYKCQVVLVSDIRALRPDKKYKFTVRRKESVDVK